MNPFFATKIKDGVPPEASSFDRGPKAFPLVVKAVAADQARSELAAEWWQLWFADPRTTPFQSPAWMLNWWEHFGAGEGWILTVRGADKLVGLLPLIVDDNERHGGRILRLMGTGPSDYLDAIPHPEWIGPVMAAIANHLEKMAEDCELIDFEELRADSPLMHLRLTNAWASETRPQSLCPVLEFPHGISDVGGIVSSGFVRRLAYYRRKAEAAGGVEVRRASAGDFSERLDDFLRLHRVRWESRGEGGVADDLALFLRKAGAEFLNDGLLRLYTMRIGDQPAATLFALSHRRSVYYFLGGFDPVFASLSPGQLLLARAIQDAIDEGSTTFDFLRGNEAYKYRWGAKDRQNFRKSFRRTLG